MVATDEFGLDDRIFFTRFKVQRQEVTACLFTGIAGRGVIVNPFQRAANAGSSDCYIALKICNVFTEQIFVSSNVGVNSQST